MADDERELDAREASLWLTKFVQQRLRQQMAKFESHITFHISAAETVKTIGASHGWKYSQIEGDALMGAKPYCYLTGYAPDGRELQQSMNAVVDAVNQQGAMALRTKIEQIVWDTKTGVNEL
jgi:hypothetical protein